MDPRRVLLPEQRPSQPLESTVRASPKAWYEVVEEGLARRIFCTVPEDALLRDQCGQKVVKGAMAVRRVKIDNHFVKLSTSAASACQPSRRRKSSQWSFYFAIRRCHSWDGLMSLSVARGNGIPPCTSEPPRPLVVALPSKPIRKRSSPVTTKRQLSKTLRHHTAPCVSDRSKQENCQCQYPILRAESVCSLSCLTNHLRSCSRRSCH